jgi:phosphoglycolate phosphatase-like HAD superfamily hydrolase
MAWIRFGDSLFNSELIAFDKDGTLIDFDYMWGRLARAWVERLTAETGEQELELDLYYSLGYDPRQGRTAPGSPLTIASTGQLQAIAAVTLYRRGIPWTEAEDRTRQAFQSVGTDLPLADLIRPVGDVAGLFNHLRGAGVRVAVVTTDHRSETEYTLDILGVANLLDGLVCGDDGIPAKPAPDMLLAACERLGVAPARSAVVGDTVADLLMSRRAGAGFKAAVLTGAGDPVQLRAHADVVLRSINEIVVEQQS